MDELLILSRLLQFAAVIVVFGWGAFRVYGLGGDTAAAFPGALAAFDAWFRRVTILGAIVALLSALTLLLAVTANMAGSAAAALDPDTISAVLFDTSFGRVWCWHLLFAVLLTGAFLCAAFTSAVLWRQLHPRRGIEPNLLAARDLARCRPV